MIEAHFSRDVFSKASPDFRISCVIADGMWYSLTKWKKIAKVDEDIIKEWINRNLESGMLVQSPTGAKSYRFPMSSVKQWHDDHEITVGDQLVDFLFPPRVWDGMTETEGFLQAPLREIGIVSFVCSPAVFDEVKEKLRGVARIREVQPRTYKAYCLEPSLVREIVEEVFSHHTPQETGKIFSRNVSKRRELCDFSKEFKDRLVFFYVAFGKTLVKKRMDTISIFLPDPEDQESQIISWVISAIEKFDESTSVPFSGYLDSVLRKWPYDLPQMILGKDLSDFQRKRSRAVVALKSKDLDGREFTASEIAEEMGIDKSEFDNFEERHKTWINTKNATSLTWEETGEEKSSSPSVVSSSKASATTDVYLANKLSFAVINTAVSTGLFDDAFTIIQQIDVNNVNIQKIKKVSEEYIQALGIELGIEGI